MKSPADLACLTPEVRTLARPASGVLLAARTVVQHSPEIRASFERARAEGLTPEQLAGLITPELETNLETTPEHAAQVAQYLADEYFQLGDSMLLIDRATGFAIARFTEEDVWMPAPVPRESGWGMAQPLPRLRPDMEGFLVSYHHDRAREGQLLARIQEKYPLTQALQEDGAPHLRVVTRHGRQDFLAELRDYLPSILGHVQGASKAFLDHFTFITEEHEGESRSRHDTAVASVRVTDILLDPLTMNLHHDRMMAFAARIGTGWVREIARTVAREANPARTSMSVQDLPDSGWFLDFGYWIIPPDGYTTFHPLATDVLPVDGVLPTGLRTPRVGMIYVDPQRYSLSSREVFGRWELEASMQFTLFFDGPSVCRVDVTDLPVHAPVEIV